MFVQATKSARQNGKTYVSYLVRESFRLPSGPRSRTVCNITDLPPDTRELIAASLKGQVFRSARPMSPIWCASPFASPAGRGRAPSATSPTCRPTPASSSPLPSRGRSSDLQDLCLLSGARVLSPPQRAAVAHRLQHHRLAARHPRAHRRFPQGAGLPICKTYVSYLVRESFRLPSGPRSRTVCNITDLPPDTRELIAASLKGQVF